MAERSDREPGSAGDPRSGAHSSGGTARSGNGKSNRGFASMSPERQREIASKGGRAAHEKGTAHEWTPEEARQAGRKGGEAVSRDRAHMAAIGREGGGARGARNRRSSQESESGSQGRESMSSSGREGGSHSAGSRRGGEGS